MGPECSLRVDSITVFRGHLRALDGVSIEVAPGEMVALIGANSAGKTTLLDAISGVVHPASGSIQFGGRDITRLSPHQIVRLGIAHVPEGRRIFPDMSVLDNLIMGSFVDRARRRRDENLRAVFRLFPRLEERKAQLAKTMSGGEQQMLALGRGLMSEPGLILIDEMSLGLAPIVVNELFAALHQIRQKGITILFVEQNVRRTLEEADRAYILKTGRVALSGDVARLRSEEEVRQAYFGV